MHWLKAINGNWVPMSDSARTPRSSLSLAAFLAKIVAWIAVFSVLVGIAWSLWLQRDTVLAVTRGDTTVDQLMQDGWEAIVGGNDANQKPAKARARAKAKVEAEKTVPQTQVAAPLIPAREIRKLRGKFKWIAKGADKTPAHWCPADGEAIEYRIDPTNAKSSGINFKQEKRAWRAAFDEWTVASGNQYTFRYAGKGSFPIAHVLSGSGILDTRVERGSIAITYAVPGRSGADYEHPRFDKVLGIGGIYNPIGTDMVIQRASVLIDASDLVLLDADTRARLRAHEIGHAMGLQHVKHFDVLMRPGQLGPTSPQPGDMAGIQKLASICIGSAD